MHWSVRLELEQWKCSAIASQMLKMNISRSPCPGFLGHMAPDFWLQSWQPVIAEAGTAWDHVTSPFWRTSNTASSTGGRVNFWFRSPCHFRPNHVESTPAISKPGRCRQPWLGHGEHTDGARSSRCNSWIQLIQPLSTLSTLSTLAKVQSLSTFFFHIRIIRR